MKVLGSNKLKKPERREDTDYREIAEVMLNSRYDKIPEDILNLWHEIIDYRNDINHSGWREKNYHKPAHFKNKLKEFIKQFESILRRA